MGVDSISCGDAIRNPEEGNRGLNWARIGTKKGRYFLGNRYARVPPLWGLLGRLVGASLGERATMSPSIPLSGLS